jgi:hypothetical protein
MVDLLLGLLIFPLLPMVTGFLWILITLADVGDYDVDPDELTAIGFFWPVMLPWLLLIVIPVYVTRRLLGQIKDQP